MKQSKLFIAAAISMLCYAHNARAQATEDNIFCPDFERADLQGHSQHLYQYLSDNKLVFLVTGDVRQSATHDLLQSYSLQKLIEDHGPAPAAKPYTTNDVRVLFLQHNADLPGAAEVQAELAALPFPAVNTDDELLPEELTGLVAPTEPGIFLVTPDHLAHPVHFTNAADAYRIAAAYQTSYRISDEPDARVIRCIAPPVAGNEITTTVYFQNYSTRRLTNATVQIFAGNTLVAEKQWQGGLGSLETTGVTLTASLNVPGALHITIQAANDHYIANNSMDLDYTRRYTAGNALSLPVLLSLSGGEPRNWNSSAQKMFSVTDANNTDAEALRVSFSSMLPLQKDTLFMGNYNLGAHPVLNFSRAYAPSSELAEAGITILASTDEGKTWTAIKNYNNTELTTTHTQSYAYHPHNGHEWIKEHINLAGFAGRQNVWLAFVATADYTNDAYIGNISLTEETPAMARK